MYVLTLVINLVNLKHNRTKRSITKMFSRVTICHYMSLLKGSTYERIPLSYFRFGYYRFGLWDYEPTEHDSHWKPQNNCIAFTQICHVCRNRENPSLSVALSPPLCASPTSSFTHRVISQYRVITLLFAIITYSMTYGQSTPTRISIYVL